MNLLEHKNTQSIYVSIQDHTGDRKLKLDWDPNDEIANHNISEMFKDLQHNGYRFFSVKKVLGIFTKKGKEVKTYDPSLGELIYEKDIHTKHLPSEKMESKTEGEVPAIQNKGTQNDSSLTMYEVEKEKQEKYEEAQKYDPSKENIDTSRDYVATKPMRAG
ncbi:hypothetical protein MZM54_03085 [[Brevibacterium] frigoritolerans]|nr:hypothetical protein [Peribacillus frigoritolerans]